MKERGWIGIRDVMIAGAEGMFGPRGEGRWLRSAAALVSLALIAGIYLKYPSAREIDEFGAEREMKASGEEDHGRISDFLGYFSPDALAEGAEADRAISALRRAGVSEPPLRISESGLPGWREVLMLDGPLLLSEDGRFLIAGKWFDLDLNLDITRLRKAEIDLAKGYNEADLAYKGNVDLDSLPPAPKGLFHASPEQTNGKAGNESGTGLAEGLAVYRSSMESFRPFAPMDGKGSNDETTLILAFTDPTCSVCGKLHGDLDEIGELGISVKYMFLPRSALAESPRAEREVSNLAAALCSDSPRTAISALYHGRELDDGACQEGQALEDQTAVVLGHLAASQMLGVRRTPAFLLPNGALITGYGTSQGLVRRVTEALEAS